MLFSMFFVDNEEGEVSYEEGRGGGRRRRRRRRGRRKRGGREFFLNYFLGDGVIEVINTSMRDNFFVRL